MPLARCMHCQRRYAAKPYGVYWAWNRADRVRVAHRSLLCSDCFTEHVAELCFLDNTVETLTCPKCGIATEEDYDAVYATVYIPNGPPVTIEAPFCGACAANYRTWILGASAPLEDRSGVDVDPRTHVSGVEVLRSMGIQPRAL